MTKRPEDAASPGPFAQEDESCDTASEPSSDAKSQTLDFESEDGAQDAESIHDNPQDGKPDNLNDEKTTEEIITLARKLAALHVPPPLREALRDEIKFRIGSAARIVGIASD
ncbi:hypothetical protein GCG54_00006543 [Colletotrichum gloeosporioides]|uniref:Uncharacterized protein n=1 Tax=Colletotrichum gloeosporioides TaxID=474922 RepID=A0A8H4CRA3_COLGL|nr:uncharacterized protein GCG54_00006543 [Colletotrichum gloeosporioides]KAF3808676.1 hypothetical protein GCG54_00006543 [Colletotrichum gloeosporioides]